MWTKENIPDQAGKTIIVTGANTGIGFETALALYEKGADVIVASRDDIKADQAVNKIREIKSSGSVQSEILDLTDYRAITQFVNIIQTKYNGIDVLINNAGVMMPPASLTKDGHELQFGVNFLGHFVLTALLFSLLEKAPQGRIVTVSSGANMLSTGIDYNNLKLEKSYDANREYADSKLANMIFMYELQRRIDSSSTNIISVGAHPGVVYTDLQRHIEEETLKAAFAKYDAVMQPWQGALPSLYAATTSDVKGGDYFGPDGDKELTGYPAKSTWISPIAKDATEGKKLWKYAENVTQVRFPI